ncbi:TIGR02677 family protein [Planotetraspora sp. A-T 1434]|uniref:TIGR02677 family protein n=1 Tax=Planotetraspora sp. A-T 1434 TaxID=2979219 RepID=UPI0021C05F9E|nr:TIGR02677 family protein [Planotetraspora sp. A-T 1434]MCT9933789.1 TIGR02677 family protein [Planotetraspora sp. A-T 1434]
MADSRGGSRALDLDALAVGDRFKLFNFTQRDDYVVYLWVLRAMDRLRAVHRVQVDTDDVAAAMAELALLHDEVPLVDTSLRGRLDALAVDGIILRLEDASRAGSLARYRNRQSVYQFSELGYRAFTAVEDVLAARVRDANLSRLVFSDILDDLKSLAVANRGGDDEQVYRRLSRLDQVMEDMVRRSARFHVTLGEIVTSTEASPELFLRYKNALLTHMTDFMAELDRYVPRLHRAVLEVEATGVNTMLVRAADADDRPFLSAGERMEDWKRRWEVLRAWFTVEPGAESGAADLRRATRTAVSGVIALLRQLTEAQRGGVNRASELRHLAEWICDTPDEDAAYALMSAAFNMGSARHLGGAHDDVEQISPRATWWDAPGIEVALTPFRTGRQAGPGIPQPVRADLRARADLRRQQIAARAAEREAARGLADSGAHGRVLDEAETRVVLSLLTRALEARSVVSGRLRSATGSDDTVVLRLVPRSGGSSVRTADGLLHLPGFALELSARSGAANG